MARFPPLSPGVGGLASEILLSLGTDSVSALVLGFWGDVDFKDWGGGRGSEPSDFVLSRGFESCEGIPLRCVHSGLEAVDAVRLRRRDGG